MYWIVLGLIGIVVEVFTVTFFSLSVSAGCLVAAILQEAGLSFSLQLIGFVLTTVLFILLLRPLLYKHNSNKFNAASLIGRTFPADGPIDERHGSLTINGSLWQARSTTPIAPGKTVEIIRIIGNTLQVKETER